METKTFTKEELADHEAKVIGAALGIIALAYQMRGVPVILVDDLVSIGSQIIDGFAEENNDGS